MLSPRHSNSAADVSKDKKKDGVLSPRGSVGSAGEASKEAFRSTRGRKSGSLSKGKGKKLLGKIAGAKSSVEVTANLIESGSEPDEEPVSASKRQFAHFLLEQSLAILGLSPAEVQEIQSYIKQGYSPNVENHFTLPDAEIAKSIRLRLDDFENADKNHSSAKAIQSLFRCWRVRRRLLPYLGKSI